LKLGFFETNKHASENYFMLRLPQDYKAQNYLILRKEIYYAGLGQYGGRASQLYRG